MRDAHLRSVECYQRRFRLCAPQGTRFDTVRGKNPPRNPAATGGCDGTPDDIDHGAMLGFDQEELHAYAEPFLARGIADPGRSTGRGRAKPSTKSRSAATTSAPRRAVCDWIEKRADLDRRRSPCGA